MIKTYAYRTSGTCSQEIFITLDDDKVTDVRFIGGCDGNAKGVGALSRDRDSAEVISLLKGIRCGYKSTSCPDQLATALEMIRRGDIDGKKIREVTDRP